MKDDTLKNNGLVNDLYIQSFPTTSTVLPALGLPWVSHLPGITEKAQGVPLFEDQRIVRLLGRINVNGKSVLELGPLEAGHSYMLEKAGAKVTGVEGNLQAFLKCLIVKNIYNLSATFLLGDFVTYLESSQTPKYDVILASGVLYHMTDPLRFLPALSMKSDVLFFWTHYYNRAKPRQEIKQKPEIILFKGKKIGYYLYSYINTKSANFIGGMHPYSHWMERECILKVLSALGYISLEILNETPDHQNGPAFCLLAKRGKG
jgi:hypothetical protein